MIRDGWLASGGERASPYKALPRGSSATVSLVENIRRRGKTRVSCKRCVECLFSAKYDSSCRVIDAPFRDALDDIDSSKISERNTSTLKKSEERRFCAEQCDQVHRSIIRF